MKKKKKQKLSEKYPPSDPCSCDICVNYCLRPGWWTVEEAERAIHAGYAERMMLEMAPEMTFGVLSPAFKGCEGNFAMNIFANDGCNFLKDNRCELFGSGVEPLECRFCHHDRIGLGKKCHSDLENDWNTAEGRALITQWARIVKLLEKRRATGII
jgi:hypothetical protein